MLTLSSVAFAHASRWILEHARPLEISLFAYMFEGGPASDVVSALKGYQNSDGGFGNALEPDVRAPGSGGLATSIALAHLASVGVSGDDPVVARALEWAASNLDRSTRVWPLLPTDSNTYPHAPWWHDVGGSVFRNFGGFRIMPRAKMLAALWHYADDIQRDMLTPLVEDTISTIEQVSAAEMWVDAYEHAAELADAVGEARPEWRQRVLTRLGPLAAHNVARDPAQWTAYSITPLRLAPTPRALLAGTLADVVPTQLDYLITHQGDDGAWMPNWDWAGQYPDAWQVALREWRGIVTLQALMALSAYGRLDDDD